MILEIMKCYHCGRHVAAVGETSAATTRIHNHKCAGRWEVVVELPMREDEARRLVKEVETLLATSDSGDEANG